MPYIEKLPLIFLEEIACICYNKGKEKDRKGEGGGQMDKKVLVGMSGGVDSSVAAFLLQQQGYQVVGITFKLWNPEEEDGLPSSCCSVDDVNDARLVCDRLGIPHYVFNYKELFRQKVVDPFIQAYLQGKTPNPCIACNRHIKFDAFLSKALSMDFSYIATGHYACVDWDSSSGRYRLRRSAYLPKDQSYVLYHLTQQQLAHTLMPLGGYTKAQVRQIAAQQGLLVKDKAESQDICFIPDGDTSGFLSRHLPSEGETAGNFLDLQGRVLGRHRGIWNYTIGQRKGLGLSFPQPMYVCRIDPEANAVVLSENDRLFSDTLTVGELNWLSIPTPNSPIPVQAKIRYSHIPAPAMLYPTDGEQVRLVFSTPQRAITRGQAAVFYDGELLLGGGVIL